MWWHCVCADHYLTMISCNNQNSTRSQSVLNFSDYAVSTSQLCFIKTAKASFMGNLVNTVVVGIDEFFATSQKLPNFDRDA